MFIRTERLFLRPSFSEDWEAMYDRIADEGIVRNLARAPWPYRASDAKIFAARAQDPWRPGFVITMPDSAGAPIVGQIGLGLNPDAHGEETQLGYWIARPYWGRGIASEAGAAILRAAHMLGHRRIFAGHFLDNPASGRVLLKLGFRSTGEISPLFSCARGEEAPSLHYECFLDEVADECEATRAA
ncbi:GNAT family N-acetyltransferase [Altererythrobacter aquiaggeris]|uniref:GNAT family N-acetyltransferase n=1 Tax=Aestuarierythrobacter aquiaggeris TaxID=1898396 RepID=UPI0030198187